MNYQNTSASVILLLDGQSANKNEFIKEWLDESPFVINQPDDFFEVLEDLSDFTVRSRPQIFLVEVDSLKNDYVNIRNMMRTFSDDKDFPIFALSDSGKVVNDKRCFEGNLAEVKAQLIKVLPNTFAKTAPAV